MFDMQLIHRYCCQPMPTEDLNANSCALNMDKDLLGRIYFFGSKIIFRKRFLVSHLQLITEKVALKSF